jgi:hypothetical protein
VQTLNTTRAIDNRETNGILLCSFTEDGAAAGYGDMSHPHFGSGMTFNCANGKPGSLSLPTECLHALIMTLPRMMTQALLARYGDDSLRLVYPAEAVRIERSPDPNTFIMTLVTPDGFAVSFSLSKQQLRALSESGMNA